MSLGNQSIATVQFPKQPWSEPKIAHFKALKFIFMWIKHGKKSISKSAIIGFDHGLPCRVKNMALGPQLQQKPRPSAPVFVYWVPRAMFFTQHGRPWSNPAISPMDYVHYSSFDAFCCGAVNIDFTHFLQDYFTSIGAIIWWPLCLWSNPGGYG